MCLIIKYEFIHPINMNKVEFSHCILSLSINQCEWILQYHQYPKKKKKKVMGLHEYNDKLDFCVWVL